jgi:hypothetical protein
MATNEELNKEYKKSFLGWKSFPIMTRQDASVETYRFYTEVVTPERKTARASVLAAFDLACQLCKVRGLPDQCLHKIATLPRWEAEDRRTAEDLDRAPRTAEYIARPALPEESAKSQSRPKREREDAAEFVSPI